MKTLSLKAVALVSLFSAALAAPAWATPTEDCQRAIDEVSVTGRANYDTATEAEMTKYLSAANTFLIQNQKAKAAGELKVYQGKLAAAVKAKKVAEKDNATISASLNKAMKCVDGLK